MGQNYLKSLFAVAFKGFLITVCVAIYAVLLNGTLFAGNIHTPYGASWAIRCCFASPCSRRVVSPSPYSQRIMSTMPENSTETAPLRLDVNVRPITPKNNLLAFASVKIADCFVVDNIKIVAGENGLFVDMPSAQDSRGKFHDVCFPVTAEFRQQLNSVILEDYVVAVEKVQGIGEAQREFTEKPSIKDQFREGAKASAMRNAGMPKAQDMPKRADISI